MWNSKEETRSRDEMSRLQNQRLRDLVGRVYERVPFYKRKMEERGVSPSDIRGISDIAKLPFTTKDEMREVYPLGLLAVDLKEIVEIHTSSGTTGKSVVDAYTPADIDIWSEVMARTLGMGDVTRADVIQNAYGYGLFTGGLGVHYGARKIGATIIPISGGNTRRQLPGAPGLPLDRTDLHPVLRTVSGGSGAGGGPRFFPVSAPGRLLRCGTVERKHEEGNRDEPASGRL